MHRQQHAAPCRSPVCTRITIMFIYHDLLSKSLYHVHKHHPASCTCYVMQVCVHTFHSIHAPKDLLIQLTICTAQHRGDHSINYITNIFLIIENKNKIISSKELIYRTREYLSAKCLSCKENNLSLLPRTHFKKLGEVAYAGNPRAAEADGGSLGLTSQPTKPAQRVPGQDRTGEFLSQRKKLAVLRTNTGCCLLALAHPAHVHAHIPTHIHMHTMNEHNSYVLQCGCPIQFKRTINIYVKDINVTQIKLKDKQSLLNLKLPLFQ